MIILIHCCCKCILYCSEVDENTDENENQEPVYYAKTPKKLKKNPENDIEYPEVFIRNPPIPYNNSFIIEPGALGFEEGIEF